MTHAIDIHTRTADTATVDGQLVQRGHYDTIYDAALAHVVNRAQDLGRPVLVKATDGVESGHTFWITVATDGSVEPARPPTDEPASTGQPPPAARTGGRRRHSEPDDINENDFYPAPFGVGFVAGQSSDAPVEPRIVDSTPWLPTIGPPIDIPQPARSPAGPDDTAGVTPISESSPPFEPAPVQDQTSRHSDPDPRTGPIQMTAPHPQPQGPASREPYAQQGQAWQRPPQPQPQHPGQVPVQQPPWTAQPPARHAPQSPMGPPPSLADLRASRPDAPEAPATAGWRGGFNRATGGLFKLAPSEDELRLRRSRDAVQRSLRGPRTVVVINTKGGGGKTTAVYSLAATFGQARGGYVLGWDNNETRGTLAWRSAPARHTNTAVDLLRDLERFEDSRNARVGDLDNYVRAQGSAQFNVLASDENAASAASIDDAAFRALHRSLSRFYRILVIDTGNNVKAPNWGAAIDLADQLVVVSSIREDTAGGAFWTLDHLTEMGHGDKVRNAVTILSAPKAAADPDQRAMHARFREHFAARTRTVLDVPFDPALVDGDSIVFQALSPATRQAWLIAAAAIAEGL